MPPELKPPPADALGEPIKPDDVPAPEAPLAPPDRVHLLALAFVTLVLVVLGMYITVPYLPALTWGVALAIIAWPMHVWLHQKTGMASVSALVSMTAVIILIVAPTVFVAYQLAKETASATEQVQASLAETGAKDKMAEVPGLRGVVAWMDRVEFDLEGQIRKMFAGATQDVSALAQGSLVAIFQFVIAMYVLFHVLRDRELLMRSLRGLMPMSRGECDQVFRRASDSVHANLYATVVTGVINGVGGGLVFWAAGLPAPLLWGIVMCILSILPILGTPFVWVPAFIYLIAGGQYLQASYLLAYGTLSFVVVGNYLYYRLAGAKMHMHEIPAMISFLGGLAVFGITGVILGPAIYAVAGALLEVWKGRMGSDPEPSETIPPPDKEVTGPV